MNCKRVPIQKTLTEKVPEAPKIPEVPKRPRKTLVAILLIAIVGVASVGAFIWWYGQKGEEAPPTPSPAVNTYAKYGFSIECPQSMSISEQGMLESTATNSSGMVLGELKNDEYEVVLVGWLTMVFEPDLEGALDGALKGMEDTEGLTNVNRGQIVTSAKAGDTMKYQYFNVTVEDATLFGFAISHETFYSTWGVWYNDTTDRFYQLGFLYSGQDVLPKFQQYLDSFVG